MSNGSAVCCTTELKRLDRLRREGLRRLFVKLTASLYFLAKAHTGIHQGTTSTSMPQPQAVCVHVRASYQSTKRGSRSSANASGREVQGNR